MHIEQEKLEALLKDLAQQAAADKGWGKCRWNREVKQQLVSLGSGMDLQTCASVRGLVRGACRPYWGDGCMMSSGFAVIGTVPVGDTGLPACRLLQK